MVKPTCIPTATSSVPFMIQRTATRTHTFTESVIRKMTRVARRHDAINLAQGFPDFAAPELLKDAACRAIQDDVNQYAITWGTTALRSALARKYREWYGMAVDPDREITVTCGATEAMAAVMLAAVDPGEEVIVLEPSTRTTDPTPSCAKPCPSFCRFDHPASGWIPTSCDEWLPTVRGPSSSTRPTTRRDASSIAKK